MADSFPVANDRILIAFDGECLMCSKSIRFLAGNDSGDRLRFTRLQDPAGQEMIRQIGDPSIDSMIVRRGEEVLMKSDALLATLRAMGSIWKVPSCLGRCVPKFLRDRVYDFIAARRYKWFGKGDACAMPSEALMRRLVTEAELGKS